MKYKYGDMVNVIRRGYECRGKIVRGVYSQFREDEEAQYQIEPVRGSKIEADFTVYESEILV